MLTTPNAGYDNLAQSLALGDTLVFGANIVNSLRFAYNRTSTHQTQVDFFEPKDLGSKVYSYIPHRMVLAITDGFAISSGIAVKGDFGTDAFQLGDDLTLVRGRHQMSVGGEHGVLDLRPGGTRQVRRQLDVQRTGHRPGTCRLHGGAGRDPRARRADELTD